MRTLGYTVDEMLSQQFLNFVHPDDRQGTQREVDKLAQGVDVVHFENRYQCKDGSWRWLAWTCPAPLEGSELLHAVARDITQQKETEEELRIRDSILTSMQNGLLITDARRPDNPIIYCNDAFLELTGYVRDEILGQNCRFLQGKDHNQEQMGQLRTAIAEGRSCRSLLRNYRKDGSLFWNELIIAPVYDDEQQLTHFVGIQHDISELVRANQERSQELDDKITALPPRQRELLNLLVAGDNTKSAARKMGISAKTVEGHRVRLLDNMEVDSVLTLVRFVLAGQPH